MKRSILTNGVPHRKTTFSLCQSELLSVVSFRAELNESEVNPKLLSCWWHASFLVITDGTLATFEAVT